MKINTNSNAYTIIYAAIMVVIVAFLLAAVSSSLRSRQNENEEADTKKQILASAHIEDVNDAASMFESVGMSDMLMQADGSLIPYDGSFCTSYKGEIYEGRYHVFCCTVEGEAKYIFPVYGAGLWGPIWGYICLNNDKDTVYGVYFSHSSETPGLGAEIANPKFQSRFPGRSVLRDGEVALGVVKNGQVTDPQYQVDGVSGGTITSKGVDAMIKSCLSAYVPFLTQNDEEEAL